MNKNEPKKWSYGYSKDSWRWNKDCQCYLHYVGVMTLPDSYCLGDRMIYPAHGFDSYGVLWNGSTSDSWNNCTFGYDLKSAIEWLHQTEYSKMGCDLWSK